MKTQIRRPHKRPRLLEKNIDIILHALDICESDYVDIGSESAERTLKEIESARNKLYAILNARKSRTVKKSKTK